MKLVSQRLIWVALALCLWACATQETANSNRDSARIHTELGSGYYAQRQLAIAQEEFTTAVRFDPTYALAHNGLGLVHSALNEDDKADEDFKQAIKLDPGNSESRNNYGTFLCSRNRIDESIVQFLEAVKNPLYTSSSTAYMNAGVCSLRKKDIAHAETYFTKALQLQPLYSPAAYQLATIYFNRKQAAKARDVLKDVLFNNPSPELLWLAIRIERILGNKDAESSYALELRKKYPNSEQTKALLTGQ